MAEERDLDRFAATLRRALDASTMTRAELAERCGVRSASAVTNWLAGTKEPRPDNVFALERALELPAGTLSRQLGYVPVDAEPPGVLEALLADERISGDARGPLIAFYRLALGPQQIDG